ncbi:hypothetical protein E2C01_003146 [Portunus trituberculatus]|uniref:Uncharacterized protein n=1 Tax=Portunus trituberculatus TaxID=210409 RepID=A0A5B7CN72_PORTR|nr:hypothetical protein [Portunus trituberculatus]
MRRNLLLREALALLPPTTHRYHHHHCHCCRHHHRRASFANLCLGLLFSSLDLRDIQYHTLLLLVLLFVRLTEMFAAVVVARRGERLI